MVDPQADPQRDRWTREEATPGQDPRETDAARTTEAGARDILERETVTHPQQPTGGMGTSSDAPGRDLDDLQTGTTTPPDTVAQRDLPQADLD